MGILRALWDQASDTDSRLILYIPDFSLVQTLRACPASFFSEVTEWLHETFRMLLSSSSTFLVHTSPTPAPQGSYTSADLRKYLAHASVQTGLSPHPSGAGVRTWPDDHHHFFHSCADGVFPDWSPR